MKKIGIFLVLSFFLLSNTLFSSNANCIKISKKIHDLQNSIVENSFIKLSPGAWALYSKNIKIVYLGDKISPKTGRKLKVVELQGKIKGQLWFKISNKNYVYSGRKIQFKTLEPMEAYLVAGNGVYYISKELIEFFMNLSGGKGWSIILWEGKINVPPDCDKDKTKIYEKDYLLESGKTVRATIIKSLENKGEIWSSDKVPFGYIKTISSESDDLSPYLVDFSFSGGKQSLSENKIKKSKLMPFMRGI